MSMDLQSTSTSGEHVLPASLSAGTAIVRVGDLARRCDFAWVYQVLARSLGTKTLPEQTYAGIFEALTKSDGKPITGIELCVDFLAGRKGARRPRVYGMRTDEPLNCALPLVGSMDAGTSTDTGQIGIALDFIAVERFANLRVAAEALEEVSPDVIIAACLEELAY